LKDEPVILPYDRDLAFSHLTFFNSVKNFFVAIWVECETLRGRGNVKKVSTKRTFRRRIIVTKNIEKMFHKNRKSSQQFSIITLRIKSHSIWTHKVRWERNQKLCRWRYHDTL